MEIHPVKTAAQTQANRNFKIFQGDENAYIKVIGSGYCGHIDDWQRSDGLRGF